MSTRLTGSTALVTGSTSGIGRATAEALAGAGAHVIVSGRDSERGEEVVAEIRAAGGKADFIAADLSHAKGVHALAEQSAAVTGRIDVLVNNAGIYTFGSTAEETAATFDRMYTINVKAPYLLVGALAPQMAARGTGTIVNITTGTEAMGEGAIDSFAVGIPAARVAQPHEIASMVAYLASDEASYVQGAIVAVDGGFSAV